MSEATKREADLGREVEEAGRHASLLAQVGGRTKRTLMALRRKLRGAARAPNS